MLPEMIGGIVALVVATSIWVMVWVGQ